MIIVIRIDIYNCLIGAKTDTIMINQSFSARHQVELFRRDFEHYQYMQGNADVSIFFHYKEPINP